MSDVDVGWDVSNDQFAAWTRTDRAGRFTLCELPAYSLVQVVAFRANEYAWTWVDAGGDTSIELTLEAYK